MADRSTTSGASRSASPWDVLLQHRPERLDASNVGTARANNSSSKTSALLEALASRVDATTLTLAVMCDLETRQVWGLLKGPRASGQVSYAAGRWSLNRSFPGADVMRAAELLRSKGWRLLPPNSTPSERLIP